MESCRMRQSMPMSSNERSLDLVSGGPTRCGTFLTCRYKGIEKCLSQEVPSFHSQVFSQFDPSIARTVDSYTIGGYMFTAVAGTL